MSRWIHVVFSLGAQAAVFSGAWIHTDSLPAAFAVWGAVWLLMPQVQQ